MVNWQYVVDLDDSGWGEFSVVGRAVTKLHFATCYTHPMIQATSRKLLRAWRRYYRLPQRKAASWLYVPLGTLHDYEQGRSELNNITRRRIEARIEDYGTEYVRYFFDFLTLTQMFQILH